MKKIELLLIAMLAAGTATFLYAVLRTRETEMKVPYARPEGGEREGGFELYIGS